MSKLPLPDRRLFIHGPQVSAPAGFFLTAANKISPLSEQKRVQRIQMKRPSPCLQPHC
jgi:hypothetical protein